MKAQAQFMRRSVAFSLVEVTMALGIVSFCLVAVVGLLPVGLQTAKNSREQAAAAVCVEQIAAAVEGAVLDANGVFRGKGVLEGLSWASDGPETSLGPLRNLSLGGLLTDDSIDERLVAYIVIDPPGRLGSGEPAGSALITVGWPNQAEWNQASGTWSRERGSVTTRLIFLPDR